MTWLNEVMAIGGNSHVDFARKGAVCQGCDRALEEGEAVFLDEDNNKAYCEVIRFGPKQSCAGDARDEYMRVHNPVLIG